MGLKIKFADIERDTMNISIDSVKKLITKKQSAAQKAKLKKYAKNLKPLPKPKMKGGIVGGGGIGGGKILSGAKQIGKFAAKHIAKKGGPKVLDKNIKK